MYEFDGKSLYYIYCCYIIKMIIITMIKYDFLNYKDYINLLS